MTSVCPAHDAPTLPSFGGSTAARVLELTPDIAVVTDLEGSILFANAALERRVGVPVDELLGRSPATSSTPRTASRARPALARAASRASATASSSRCASGSRRHRLALVPGQRRHRPRRSASASAPTRRPRRCATPRSASSAPSRTPAIGMAITGIDGRFVRVNHSLARDAGPRAAGARRRRRCATSPTPPTTRTTARRCARSRAAS